jgi:hypothetical protein
MHPAPPGDRARVGPASALRPPRLVGGGASRDARAIASVGRKGWPPGGEQVFSSRTEPTGPVRGAFSV